MLPNADSEAVVQLVRDQQEQGRRCVVIVSTSEGASSPFIQVGLDGYTIEGYESESSNSCGGVIGASGCYPESVLEEVRSRYGIPPTALVPMDKIEFPFSRDPVMPHKPLGVRSEGSVTRINAVDRYGSLSAHLIRASVDEWLASKSSGETLQVLDALVATLGADDSAALSKILDGAIDDTTGSSSATEFWKEVSSQSSRAIGDACMNRYVEDVNAELRFERYRVADDGASSLGSVEGSVGRVEEQGDSFEARDDVMLADLLSNSRRISSYANPLYWQVALHRVGQMAHSTSQVEVDEDDTEAIFRTQAIEMGELAADFNQVANMYGRVICAERYLPFRHKSIKPALKANGLVGGEKYMCGSMFFKFSIDNGMYGDDYNASKAARLDMKGLLYVFENKPPGLEVPLSCVICYKGVTLLAQALLPLEGNNSLVYGSCDGGMVIHDDDPEGRAMMDDLGARLNLEPHMCGEKKMALCGDVELHRCEGTYYLLDLARILPPEPPQSRNAVVSRGLPASEFGLYSRCWLLTRQFRPELLGASEKSLCSDAFTLWDEDPDHARHKQDIMECYQRLLTSIVPKFTEEMEKSVISDVNDLVFPLTTEMHRFGINTRHLKVVYDSFKCTNWRMICATEIAARAHKVQIYGLWSVLNSKLPKLPVEQPMINLTVKYLKAISTPNGSLGQRIWSSVGRLAELKFYSGLGARKRPAKERLFFVSLANYIHWGHFLRRLTELLGLETVQSTLNIYFQDQGIHPEWQGAVTDVVTGFVPRTYGMPAASAWHGLRLFEQAIKMRGFSPKMQDTLSNSIRALGSNQNYSINKRYLFRALLYSAVCILECTPVDSTVDEWKRVNSRAKTLHWFAVSHLESTFKGTDGTFDHMMVPRGLWVEWCALEFRFHLILAYGRFNEGISYVAVRKMLDCDRIARLIETVPFQPHDDLASDIGLRDHRSCGDINDSASVVSGTSGKDSARTSRTENSAGDSDHGGSRKRKQVARVMILEEAGMMMVFCRYMLEDSLRLSQSDTVPGQYVKNLFSVCEQVKSCRGEDVEGVFFSLFCFTTVSLEAADPSVDLSKVLCEYVEMAQKGLIYLENSRSLNAITKVNPQSLANHILRFVGLLTGQSEEVNKVGEVIDIEEGRESSARGFQAICTRAIFSGFYMCMINDREGIRRCIQKIRTSAEPNVEAHPWFAFKVNVFELYEDLMDQKDRILDLIEIADAGFSVYKSVCVYLVCRAATRQMRSWSRCNSEIILQVLDRYEGKNFQLRGEFMVEIAINRLRILVEDFEDIGRWEWEMEDRILALLEALEREMDHCTSMNAHCSVWRLAIMTTHCLRTAVVLASRIRDVSTADHILNRCYEFMAKGGNAPWMEKNDVAPAARETVEMPVSFLEHIIATFANDHEQTASVPALCLREFLESQSEMDDPTASVPATRMAEVITLFSEYQDKNARDKGVDVLCTSRNSTLATDSAFLRDLVFISSR